MILVSDTKKQESSEEHKECMRAGRTRRSQREELPLLLLLRFLSSSNTSTPAAKLKRSQLTRGRGGEEQGRDKGRGVSFRGRSFTMNTNIFSTWTLASELRSSCSNCRNCRGGEVRR